MSGKTSPKGSKAKASKAKEEANASANSAKQLKTQVDELTQTIETLNKENEMLRTKLKVICKKLVDNSDMSNYAFIEPGTEPDAIEVKDILHMIQTLVLLATQLPGDNMESHVVKLELRITELSNENSSYFKNKLKLQERLEFIMQERDVWKRNADTLKKMYAKLGKRFFLIIKLFE